MTTNIVILLLSHFVILVNGERYRVTNLEVNDINRVFVSTDVDDVIQCARKCHATNCTSFLYGEKPGSPEDVACYDGPSVKSYMGTWNKTRSGKVCQRWDSQQPHPHKLTEGMFNEDSLKDAENFCRDPTDTGKLWCYTTDPRTHKETCGIGKCSGENTCQVFLDEAGNEGSGPSKYYTKDM